MPPAEHEARERIGGGEVSSEGHLTGDQASPEGSMTTEECRVTPAGALRDVAHGSIQFFGLNASLTCCSMLL
jgi:hypothetical protein